MKADYINNINSNIPITGKNIPPALFCHWGPEFLAINSCLKHQNLVRKSNSRKHQKQDPVIPKLKVW